MYSVCVCVCVSVCLCLYIYIYIYIYISNVFMSRDQNAGQFTVWGLIRNSTFQRVEELKYLGTTLTNQNSIAEEIKSRLRSGSACYHSVQNLVSSRLLSKNLKIKIYRTILCLLFCMGVKLGRWHCGRKGSWGCLSTWCWGEYLDLGGTRYCTGGMEEIA